MITMKKAGSLIIFSLIIAGVFSCHKIEHLSPVPYIKYQNFKIFDTVDPLGNNAKGGRLTFYFEDGDGDIGLNAPPPETVEDTNNLIMQLYRKKAGVMELIPDSLNDPLKPASFRIPYMEALGQNKILRGTISVTFLYLFYTTDDTIKYDFRIRDRAENESNTESTGEIIITQNNTY